MANINWYLGYIVKNQRLIKENTSLIDIIYEVVDARMPASSKIIDIDEYICKELLNFNLNN